ncbi:MAG: polysaccharide deacetylase family protein [Bacteroidetes bacterium]|jgi:alpha-amylase|nr:polysaccharide deacetylase family protein [Bacteroidota bacterium]MBK9321171.1 polysaccharide deacetylase family protein [Bacteroidota bacterium]
MPSVCFYFQVHQPFRLKRYSFFDIGKDHFYEDDEKNKLILDKVSEKCYLKTNRKILDLINRHKGKFKVSYSISGTALEQFENHRPDVLQSFIDLSKTGCVEFLSETYYHSLSFIYSKDEFKRQVEMHREKIKLYFNQTPKVFRNTELIYNNELASFIEKMGFKAIVCEGVDRHLGNRTPNFLYQPAGTLKIKSFLKNYRLSDDIAFRFSDRNWNEWPLHADTFASWVHKIAGNGEVMNLFMDYETFGEHQWEETGVFDFLDHLPMEIMKHSDFDFKTLSEAADQYKVRDIYDVPEFTSWADAERDLSAWLSNAMEKEAAKRIYQLEEKVLLTGNKDLIDVWGKMQTSDHFYYMCTKFWSDGDVHKYFSPYDSPYDAYIYYMNVLADFETTIEETVKDITPVKKSRRRKEIADN